MTTTFFDRRLGEMGKVPLLFVGQKEEDNIIAVVVAVAA